MGDTDFGIGRQGQANPKRNRGGSSRDASHTSKLTPSLALRVRQTSPAAEQLSRLLDRLAEQVDCLADGRLRERLAPLLQPLADDVGDRAV